MGKVCFSTQIEGFQIINVSDMRKTSPCLVKPNGRALVFSKIEYTDTMSRLCPIFEASKSAIVGRGDLAASIALEDVPLIQEEIDHNNRTMRFRTIIAKHITESMINVMTTRTGKETGITQTVRHGIEAALSGETANRAFTLEAVRVMVMRTFMSSRIVLFNVCPISSVFFYDGAQGPGLRLNVQGVVVRGTSYCIEE